MVTLGSGMTTRLTQLPGSNFSGRSRAMREYTGFGPDEQTSPSTRRHLVGLDSANFLSGLALDVASELKVQGGDGWQEVDGVEALLSCVDFSLLMERNPYTLSGGEQTLLALAGALAGMPTALAIDSALEQLNPITRRQVLSVLQQQRGCEKIVVADNRLDEYPSDIPMPLDDELALVLDHQDRKCIEADKYLPYSAKPVEISLKNTQYHYKGGSNVLNGVNLNLEPGKIYLLKGPNGAGKTTLSKLLAGIYQPTEGEILVNGKASRGQTPGSTFAYHFQDPALQLFSTNVRSEVLSSAPTDDVSVPIQAFGLSGLERGHPLDLPFTLQKRLALAATLAMQRPWVILDEPTLGQDVDSVRATVEIIHQQASRGTGFLVITHSVRLMEMLDSQVIELADGVITE